MFEINDKVKFIEEQKINGKTITIERTGKICRVAEDINWLHETAYNVKLDSGGISAGILENQLEHYEYNPCEGLI